ncbi:hypothetical protein ES288_A05G042900v1 [Gossypium darwinii]|uniref:Conserved oligomeric Golgi complex subunit 8 n=1 Tax=Gossypium darwinii TaxID=34276 RepID=A0A5D2GB84_GOSDA|nr:hypothetical protein ES288_A05G042900v1 [Gossypium darwinii]
MVMEPQNGDIAVSLSAPVASAMACLLPLASVSQQPYLSELLSFTLDRLHKEPELLRVDTERIQRQMLEVAVGNYRAFISAADALVAIKEEVSSINKHLESMITVIPNLKSGCTECVRNGNYDEALDLEVFVCKLSTLHPNCHRMHHLDVVNQYRAIFSDDASGSEVNYDKGGSLSSILDQCMYCAIGLVTSCVTRLQLILDSHRWVPLPAVGFSATSISEDSQEDVTPPSYLMEQHRLQCVSVAMNELRACALVSLKKVLAQELIKGLHTVSDSLLRYNATRMLRETESGLFLSICQAFIEVAFPHGATCFGRCYPGGAALVMDVKNLYDGFSRPSIIASLKEPSKPISNVEENTTSENGDVPQAVMKIGVEPTGRIDETRISNADKEIEQSHFAD